MTHQELPWLINEIAYSRSFVGPGEQARAQGPNHTLELEEIAKTNPRLADYLRMQYCIHPDDRPTNLPRPTTIASEKVTSEDPLPLQTLPVNHVGDN